MQLSEPFAVIDTYADGIGRIEKLKGGNVRVVFYVESEHDGRVERVIVAKIVISPEEIATLRH
jgi:hypothetical protein